MTDSVETYNAIRRNLVPIAAGVVYPASASDQVAAAQMILSIDKHVALNS
jgi:hypothetical protein